jgi:aryl-phospho-beta-D-glucosidase BglC (GH1 family)
MTSGALLLVLLSGCANNDLPRANPNDSAAGATSTDSDVSTSDTDGGLFADAGDKPLGWIHASGIDFADDEGRPIHFVGVGLSNDAWGTYVWPDSDNLSKLGKDPMIRPTELYSWCLQAVDFQILSGLPINVVRYSFAYEMFAADNPKLEANLTTLEDNIERLGHLGIYTVLNDNMPVGLDGSNDSYERLLPPAERESSIFESDDFFAENLSMWQLLAARLVGRPEVLAYELINEPRVPSLADGGQARFQARMQSLVEAIRECDSKHVILIPEWNSYEDDNADQTVIWDQGMIKIDDDNIGYVLHLYTPWEFTAQAASSYDEAALTSDLDLRVKWRDNIGHAPLFASEYGVNRGQPTKRRVDWLKQVHDLFAANGISSTLFNYKSNASAYLDVASTFALAQQYVLKSSEVVTTDDGWSWSSDQTRSAAESNGFSDWYQEYFLELAPDDVSLVDSQAIVDELFRYRQIL